MTEEIAILGYCEFDKPYLKQIEVAGEDKPGINPLRIDEIRNDLDKLPTGTKAVLYFHWGMEHVWLPPYRDIELAKKILEDERVLTVIGMHPHCIQGVVKHAGKEAYMCLGNFIFPNFYVKPPVQIDYPQESEKSKVNFITRQYHAVDELTYKKWRLVNRVSIVIDFCTETFKSKAFFVIQDDNQPVVTSLSGTMLVLYKLLGPLYKGVWRVHVFEVKVTWRLQILWFHLKQVGIKGLSKKIISHVRNRN